MEWWALGLILFAAMLLLLFLGINIPFALGIIAVIGIVAMWKDPMAGLMTVAYEAYHRGTNFLILAVPMFILLAEVIMAADISREAYDSLSGFLCRVPGALAVATTALATCFAALVGSSLANAVIIGRVSIPEMIRHDYAKSLAVGVVAAGGTLGILIPPSIAMIFYSMFSGESVAKLFIAGIIPGILAASLMTLYVIIYAKLAPQIAPPLPRVSILQATKTGYKLFPMLGLIVFMMCAFYFGIATPTEIGGVAAFVGFLLAFAYRRMNWEKLKAICTATARTTIMIMWILVPALAFGTVLAYGGVPQNLTKWVAGLPISPFWILIAINIFLLLLGCVLETGAIQMVIWPLLIPIAAALGYDLIWFAIILVIQIELGQITPPVGLILFVMNALAPDVSTGEVYRGVMPFVIILCAVIGLIIAFPQIVLWLPSRM